MGVSGTWWRAVLLRLGARDRLKVVNDEGGQIGKLVAAATDGRIDAAILGQASNSGAKGLKTMLALGDAAGKGIDLARAGAVRFLHPTRRPERGPSSPHLMTLVVPCSPGPAEGPRRP